MKKALCLSLLCVSAIGWSGCNRSTSSPNASLPKDSMMGAPKMNDMSMKNDSAPMMADGMAGNRMKDDKGMQRDKAMQDEKMMKQ